MIYNIYINVIGLNMDQYQPSPSNFSVKQKQRQHILLFLNLHKTYFRPFFFQSYYHFSCNFQESISVKKKLFCSSSRRISFDRNSTILESINLVWEEINFVDKKLVCSIPGGNSFGKKF